MRDVFVHVRKNQEQFEHAVPLFGLRLVGAFLQIRDHGQCIREEQFEAVRIDRAPFTAAAQRFIRAHKSFIDKMVQA